MKKFINEFKTFIARGNVMDMAVGVIIGGAFKAIADSLTADIIMPILGIFTSEVSFADLSVTVGGAVITYGNFINAILNFLIMALVVFTMIKAINTFNDKAADQSAAVGRDLFDDPPPHDTEDQRHLDHSVFDRAGAAHRHQYAPVPRRKAPRSRPPERRPYGQTQFSANTPA